MDACKEYFDLIEEFEARRKDIQNAINKNNEVLNDFNTELELLKKKFNYDEINTTLDFLQTNKITELQKITSIKLFIVCDYIRRFFDHKYFKVMNKDEGWNLLSYKFGISASDWNCSFNDLFEEIKESFHSNEYNLIKDEKHYDCNCYHFKLFCDNYKNNRLDGGFRVRIPRNLIRDINTFAAEMTELINMNNKELNVMIKEIKEKS